MINIHNFINQPVNNTSPTSMYFNGENLICTEKGIYFFKGAQFDTFTFYNGFFIDKWSENTQLNNLNLAISGEGEAKVSLIHRDRSGREVILSSFLGDLCQMPEICIDDYSSLKKGCIYFKLEPIADGILHNARFYTNQIPPNNVKLGLVITHFNRIAEVNKSFNRIYNELLLDGYYEDKIKLKIIDNSQNSGIQSNNHVEVINNQNLGGSGGFTRGLLELDDDGSYTHCLFMDDDASCEIESIKRTYQLLQYAKDPKLAIAGSLLREDKPDIIWEKGAYFDGICRPVHGGVCASNTNNLQVVESKDRGDIYGAWWFFAFNIKEVSHYPIPFFVRGDDISFSLTNDFKIMTMNGIASYGEDFGVKSGALPLYLDLRSHLVEQLHILGDSKFKLCRTIVRFFGLATMSYQYGTARALIQAVDDFIAGPEFFDQNKDMSSRFGLIKSYAKDEVLSDEEFDPVELAWNSLEESKLRYVIRLLTLNGHLVPSIFFSKQTVFQPKGFRAHFREIFLHKKVRYVNTSNNTSYVSEMNRKELAKLSIMMLKRIKFILSNYDQIKHNYKNNMPDIMTKSYWNNVYKTEGL
ncbi:hypothetical protein [Psychromonas sp.]|uniref:hypothetical protein n=1 Tax=Psychromonas sp. TaxID=1884585 RepID=UPI00356530EA